MTPDSFLQVVLFRDERNAEKLGPVMWSVFKEVSALYNVDKPRANFKRCFLSKYVPDAIEQEVDADWSKVKKALGSDSWWDAARSTSDPSSDKLLTPSDLPGLLETLGPSDPLYETVREVSHDTLDKTALFTQVRELIGGAALSAPLVLIMDQLLSTPPTWQYIIWDGQLDREPKASVISLKPIDPKYWGIRAKSRTSSIIKQRARAACCSAVGEMLGFKRCENPACYLYMYVESVTDLDDMFNIGEEHEEPKLSKCGYSTEIENPLETQPLEYFNDSE